jgi:hypothetical protein
MTEERYNKSLVCGPLVYHFAWYSTFLYSLFNYVYGNMFCTGGGSLVINHY